MYDKSSAPRSFTATWRRAALAVILSAMIYPASAVISVVDTLPSAPFVSADAAGSTAISVPFTITSGSLTTNSVLIVELASRVGPPVNTFGSDPVNLYYNGLTLTQAVYVQSRGNAPNPREVSIYYVFNPGSGSGDNTITGTFPQNDLNYAVSAFTLSGVNTTTAPLTGDNNQNVGVNSTPVTISGIPAGSVAVFSHADTSTTAVPTFDTTSGTATIISAIGTIDPPTSTTVVQGYVLGLSAGSATFTIGPSGSSKNPFGVAVFAESGSVNVLPAIATLNVPGDAEGASSFAPFQASVPQWDNGSFPAAGTNYIVGVNGGTVASVLLRTPANGSNYTFSGDTLKINLTGSLVIKGNTGVTNTINNLILNGGTVANGGDSLASTDTETTVAGAITLTGGRRTV